MSPLPEPRPPLVFISHDRHEVALHDRVLELANELRRRGVDARVDLYEMGPAEGWAQWRERQLLAADFVVLVCTPSYRRYFEGHVPPGDEVGLAVRWEGGIVRQRLHDDPSFGSKVLPVVFEGGVDAIPELLRGFTRYAWPSEYEALYRRITAQPTHMVPALHASHQPAAPSRTPLGELRRGVHNLEPRPAVFEGREQELEVLREALRCSSSKLMTPTVLTGMGGIGKARLALEHAYRSEADYDVRWWVRASDYSTLQDDLVALGGELGVLGQPERVEPSIREVLWWLSTHRRWLLVFDHAATPHAIRKFLPNPCRGHMLITSRKSGWRAMTQSVVQLPPISTEASRAILVQRSGRPDDGHADEVAASLGHLPLALVSAGAYMEATGCSFRDYLERLAHDDLALLDDPKSMTDDGHESVVRTWELSLPEIRRRSPAAAALLEWLAFLDPGGVPLALLGLGITAMPEPIRSCVGSSTTLDDAVAVLRDFSMIERDDGVVRVHRLIQAVTRGKLSTSERSRLAAAVVRWVCTVFAYTPGRTRVDDVMPGLAEQVMAVGEVRACGDADSERLAGILLDVGDYQLARGATRAAHKAYSRAHALRLAQVDVRKGCARARRDLSIALNRLGNVEEWADQLASAHQRFSKALELRKALAYEDPLCPQRQHDLASSLGKLGEMARRAGKLPAAVELLDQAAELREALLDADPTDRLARRAFSLSSRKLGKALVELGELRDARRTLCRALEVAEGLVDADPHDSGTRRDLAFVLKDLGNLLTRDGDAARGREHLLHALALTDELASEDIGNARAQRDLSVCLTAWGLAEQRAGHFDSARRALERASTLRCAVADADRHDGQAQRDVAASLIKLADLEERAGNAEKAREHHRRAIDIETAFLLQGSAAPSRLDARADPLLPETSVPRLSIPASADLSRIDARFDPMLRETGGARLSFPADPGEIEPSNAPTSQFLEAVRQAGDLEQLGAGALESGHLETARQSLRLMTAITNVLAQVDPDTSVARRRAVTALRKLGQVERQLGDVESARSRFGRCCRILDALLPAKPTDRAMRRELALCHRELGNVEWALGSLERARESFQRSITGLEAFVKSSAGNVPLLRDYWGALVDLGRLETEAQDLETAHELFECGLDIAYEIKERQPNATLMCSEVLQVLYLLADIEIRLGNSPEPWLRRVLDEVSTLAQTDEDALAALDFVLRNAERATPAA